jgi:carboxypeptidase C (cathepsin A)
LSDASTPSPLPDPLGATARPGDQVVRRHHQVTIGDQTVRYTSTAGRLVLHRERLGSGEREGRWEGAAATAEVFFIAYTRDGTGDLASRPVTFSFNGGPGSSSVWLHLGLLGPRRVPLPNDPEASPPPYRLVDNAESLLDVTDLVFIDPVSTGYSRAVPGERPADFHGLKADIETVGDFVRLWTTRNGRWTSPAFLIGESYGTTRAAALAPYLQDRYGLYLAGVMLVSNVLDFSTGRFEVGNDLPFVTNLPTYAAVAHYHGVIAEDLRALPLRELLDEVEAWALSRYAYYLVLGDRAEAALRAEVRERLGRYTGLSADYLDRCHLRPDMWRFCKELLRDQHRTIGRLDGRYCGADRDAAGDRFERDPSYAAILGAYGSTFNDYVRRELGFESDLPYEVLTSLFETWRWDDHQNRFVNVAESLRAAMHANPHLQVHIASGYYDLATPYFGSDHAVAHMALDPALRGNVRTSYYEAGHMMYVHEPSLRALSADLRAFVRGRTGSG